MPLVSIPAPLLALMTLVLTLVTVIEAVS